MAAGVIPNLARLERDVAQVFHYRCTAAFWREAAAAARELGREEFARQCDEYAEGAATRAAKLGRTILNGRPTR